MSLCSCTSKLAKSSTDLATEVSLDAHGCVMAQATGFDACAVLPQFSAIAASESACPTIVTLAPASERFKCADDSLGPSLCGQA